MARKAGTWGRNSSDTTSETDSKAAAVRLESPLVTKPLPVLNQKPSVRRWFDEGLRFECTACGNCCTGPSGYVWIEPEEIERLARHLGHDIEDVHKRYLRKIGSRYSLRERKTLVGDYDCIFMIDLPDAPDGSRRRGCGIYPVRPLQCRTFPFWDGIVASRRSWESAARHCPGLNRGKLYSRNRIEALRDASEWPQDAPSTELI